MAKQKTEHELKKELLDLQEKHSIEQHKRRMEELEYIRETNRISHEDELTRGRIKSAEIKKAFDRKELSNMRRWQR